MNQKIVIDFEGRLTIDAHKVHFIHAGTTEVIPGSMYLELTDAEQQEFVINNIDQVFSEADDFEWEKLLVVDNQNG